MERVLYSDHSRMALLGGETNRSMRQKREMTHTQTRQWDRGGKLNIMRNEGRGYRKQAHDKQGIKVKWRCHVFNTWSAAGGHIWGGCGNAGRLA